MANGTSKAIIFEATLYYIYIYFYYIKVKDIRLY